MCAIMMIPQPIIPHVDHPAAEHTSDETVPDIDNAIDMITDADHTAEMISDMNHTADMITDADHTADMISDTNHTAEMISDTISSVPDLLWTDVFSEEPCQYHLLIGVTVQDEEEDGEDTDTSSIIFESDTDSEYNGTDQDEPNDVQQIHPTLHIRVLVRAPTADAECPISLDKISASEVPGFEGFLMNPLFPEFREMVLPCQHAFAANFLVVSWLTSPMRCPLCREGCDMKLDPTCLPTPWHKQARDYVERIQNEATTEQLAMDHDEALRSALGQTASIQLYMCAYIIHSDGVVESTILHFSPHSTEIPEDPARDLILSVSRASVRGVSGLIRRAGCVGMNLVVFARCVGREVELIEVANSGLMAMPLREDDVDEGVARHVHPTQLIRIVQQSSLQDSSAHMGISRFTTDWQQYPNRTMDTLTHISFGIAFGDLALVVSGLFLVASTTS